MCFEDIEDDHGEHRHFAFLFLHGVWHCRDTGSDTGHQSDSSADDYGGLKKRDDEDRGLEFYEPSRCALERQFVGYVGG